MNKGTLQTPFFALLIAGTSVSSAFSQASTAPAPQSPAAVSQLMAPIDRELLDLDTRLEVIERGYASIVAGKPGGQPRDLGARCLTIATPAHIVANFRNLVHDPAAMNPNDVLAGHVLDYFECRALISGDKTACEGARGVFTTRNANPDVVQICEAKSSQVLAFRSLIRGDSDFQQRCLQDFKTLNNARACGIIERDWRDPARASAEVESMVAGQPSSRAKNKKDEVQSLLKGVNGDGSACDSNPADSQDDCKTMAAFNRAYTTHNASACGADLRCRAMMNTNAGYCVAFAKDAAKSYCQIQEILVRERRSDFGNSVSDLETAFHQFTQVEAATSQQIRSSLENINSLLRPQDRELAQQIDDRYERLASIETRADRLAPKLVIRPSSGK